MSATTGNKVAGNTAAASHSAQGKPHLSLSRIIQMNLGFLGLQFSFGLQQGNMGPIYSYLGAKEAELPLLLLAGPLTGLIVQPIVGAMSDRTASKWGRRTPYFVAGAILCALGLLFMPFSQSLVMAVSLLWLIDIGNNTTMEPYRAFVSDRLNADQHQAGYLTQSAFTGLAQMLAFLTPSLLVWFGMNQDWVDANNIPYTVRIVFIFGAVLSLSTILYSILRVPELPITPAQRAHIAAQPKGVAAVFREIGSAIIEMPAAMRRLGWMSLFQWYGMAAYWSYVIYSIGRSVYGTGDAGSSEFRTAVLTNGEMAAFYNAVAFVSALAMMPLSKRYGAGVMHAICLTCGGLAMIALPHIADKWMLFIPAVGVGLAWGSIMGNPYIILAGAIPPERTGVYMGIFNMMIVIPMILFAFTLPVIYGGDAPATFFGLFALPSVNLLGGDPRNVLTMAGILLILAAISVLQVKEGWRKSQG